MVLALTYPNPLKKVAKTLALRGNFRTISVQSCGRGKANNLKGGEPIDREAKTVL